ncbi:conserved hypothetical protein [Culex quinquefasciatus]|uniref:Uncharacterized protein n=1 Tax=Culex quinquefasciatus TaxID=7176 RepID=B0WID5_CULQU|nr:conserved hypothetical protein [Culex quinquefasciatus]|eukprot:XP_001848469.1 conserved hypothetical protein [Culex quinquefasciatus]
MVSTSSAELIRCSGLFRIRFSERKFCLRESKLTGEDSAKFASSRSPVRRSFSKCGCVYGKPVFRRNKDVSLRRDFDSGGCVLDELPRTATKNSECEKARCAVWGSTVDIAGSAGPKKFAKKTTTAENYYEHRSGSVAVMVGRCDDVIIIGFADSAVASSIIDKPLVYQGCKIPIYLDNNATEVRVLDLPLGISNDDVVKVMSKYGEILTITNDRWINFFPGIPNGVRTLRMLLKQPTPKSITVNNAAATVTIIGKKSLCKLKAKNKKCADSTKKVNQKSSTPPIDPEPSSSSSSKSNNMLQVSVLRSVLLRLLDQVKRKMKVLKKLHPHQPVHRKAKGRSFVNFLSEPQQNSYDRDHLLRTSNNNRQINDV